MPDCTGFEPACGTRPLLPITQFIGPSKWRARWESNPRLPNRFGCSIAVELRDCPRHGALRHIKDAVLCRVRGERNSSANYDGQVVPQDGDLLSGNRTRPKLASGRSLMASGLPLAWRITCNFRPIEIGVTNRIRTGTNAFTGRDAACYIMITIQTGAPGRTRTDEYGFTKPAL